MTRQILVPIDDSDRSTAALEFAVENYPEDRLVAFHAIDPGNFPTGGLEAGAFGDFERVRKNYEEQAEQLLERAAESAIEAGVDVETVVEIGRPARTIVEYADEHDVDHVVIGSHGRTGASRILLGSVAEAVTRRSSVPVTIVR